MVGVRSRTRLHPWRASLQVAVMTMLDELLLRMAGLNDGNAQPSTIQLINDMATALEALRAERDALRLFMGAAYPVAPEINPRGYNWSEAYLDQALDAARKALGD